LLKIDISRKLGLARSWQTNKYPCIIHFASPIDSQKKTIFCSFRSVEAPHHSVTERSRAISTALQRRARRICDPRPCCRSPPTIPHPVLAGAHHHSGPGSTRRFRLASLSPRGAAHTCSPPSATPAHSSCTNRSGKAARVVWAAQSCPAQKRRAASICIFVVPTHGCCSHLHLYFPHISHPAACPCLGSSPSTSYKLSSLPTSI
jgi:hypothetical protein